jgi:hypothetical protein
MIDSINLRHFPELDPTSLSAKDALRAKIKAQIEQYLSTRGAITPLTEKDYTPFRVNMKREDVINYLKTRDIKRRYYNQITPDIK